MKYLPLVLLFVSCGMTVKHKVSGDVNVNAPTQYKLQAEFSVPAQTFESVCAQKYKDVGSSADRNALIDQCIAQNQSMVQQLINALNKVPVPTPTPGV